MNPLSIAGEETTRKVTALGDLSTTQVPSVPAPAQPRSTPGRRRQVLLAVALTGSALALGLLLHMWLIGRIQHSASQQRLHDQFRAALAQGTAPTGGLDATGRPVRGGTPMGVLEIRRLGVREVVVEGTAAANLFRGPGHRRDTVFPGQAGTSVILGRRSLYGGPFASIGTLRRGDEILVTTAQGNFRFLVIGVRRAGDPLPPVRARAAARLELVTAAGSTIAPDGVVRLDAELDGQAVAARPQGTTALPGEEQEFSGDVRSMAILALWLQALLVVAVAAVWSWRRWGRAQTWVVFAPLLVLVGTRVGGELLRLIPNVA